MRSGIGSLEKAAEQPPDKRTQRNAEHDRRRDAQKVRSVGAAALRRVQKRCKQHNDEDIVARCAGQDHLRDALVRSAAAFHQLHHARHDDRGDTAASTEPMTAASTRVTPRKHGASST